MKTPPQKKIDALLKLYHSGQFAAAEQACQRLLRTWPHSVQALDIMSSAQLAQGKTADALKTIDRIITLRPNGADGHLKRGAVLTNIGHNQAGIDSYKRAIKIKPAFAEAHYNLGLAQQNLGMLKDAEIAYREALRHKPDYVEAFDNLGIVLYQMGNFEQAAAHHQQATTIHPLFASAFSNHGIALQALDRTEEAIEKYQQAIALQPDFARAHCNLCGIYEKQNRLDDLKISLLRAQKALPADNPELLYCNAQLANAENRHDETRQFLERISPHQLPSNLRQSRAELLAKTYDKLGRYHDAFTQLENANNIAAQSPEAQQFSAQRYLNHVEHLSASWSRTEQLSWQPSSQSDDGYSLAFLVGFPRSGTTLLDTILRSHPAIALIEEQPLIHAVESSLNKPALVETLDVMTSHDIDRLRDIYRQQVAQHVDLSAAPSLIIDKLPLNLVSAGLIHRIFPEAKFILALRHPCDCVLSCFMQSFTVNDAMANFLTLQQSATLYDAAMRLWTQYNTALDIDSASVKYEDLVQDLRGTVEPILHHLDLTWHDDLLNYQQTALGRGGINTPSYNQVTRKLYSQASGRWHNYRDNLQPVMPTLQPWVEHFDYAL